MKVLLTGGTGFVGTAVRKELRRRRHQVRLLVRTTSREKWAPLLDDPGIEIVQGDIGDPLAAKKATEAVEAVIHLVGIIRESVGSHGSFEWVHVRGTETLIEAAQDNGVTRVMYVSALGASRAADTRYFRTKYAAEQAVKNSGLNYTILRPSIIWGKNDNFTTLLRRYIHGTIPFFIPGAGKTEFQPVRVRDFAQGLVTTLTLKDAFNTTFEIGGPEQLTFSRMLDRIAADKGLKRYFAIPVPYPLVMPITALFQYMPFFPLTVQQLKMLNRDNVTDDTRFWEMTGIHPREFLRKPGGIPL